MSKRYGPIERYLFDESELVNAIAIIMFLIGAVVFGGVIVTSIGFIDVAFKFVMWMAIASSAPYFGLGLGICIRANKIKRLAKMVGEQEKLLDELYGRVCNLEVRICNNGSRETNQDCGVNNSSTKELFSEEKNNIVFDGEKNNESAIDFAKMEKIEILREYEKLYENNMISEEEYTKKKNQILNLND